MWRVRARLTGSSRHCVSSNARVRMVGPPRVPRLLRFQPIAKIPRATASVLDRGRPARLEPCGFQFPRMIGILDVQQFVEQAELGGNSLTS